VEERAHGFVVGSHWNRYGQAGKYDSGKYDTFVFGRTHVIGYKARGEIDIGDVTLWAEQVSVRIGRTRASTTLRASRCSITGTRDSNTAR